MKQILQSLKTGRINLTDVPCPQISSAHLLIRTTCSLISPGTERMLMDFGKASLVDKARKQPDKVKLVLDKVRTEGVMPTLDAVLHKLDQPFPLGYCNVGRVVECGMGTGSFRVGDRVASNGNHAEIVRVPINLCAPVPDAVSDEAAAFTVIGAVALQGIRLAKPSLGESVVVTGLGLVGQMTVQLLRAQGCRVLGIDIDDSRLQMAARFGAEVVNLNVGEDPLSASERFSRGRGVDAVIVTAATSSSEPIHQAACMCRQRGRIILVGVTGLKLSRDDFFKKELRFQVSCSYGPGRYDPNYEDLGQDYPVGFVRWTEQRNFEAVLDMLAGRRLDVAPLISHRFHFDQAEAAYEVVGGSEPSMGIVLQYASPSDLSDASLRASCVAIATPSFSSSRKPSAESVQVGFIGSGNYATAVLMPAFQEAGSRLVSVASSGGVSGIHFGKKFAFAKTTTDTAELFAESDINTIVIATRHNSHARFVCEALRAGKHVFVEKPLCLSLNELEKIRSVYSEVVSSPVRTPLLMVGFNRRFAPQIQKMKTLLASVDAPKAFVMTINAGVIPADHWTLDPNIGGGRIVGEACHFIDLLLFLAGCCITSYSRSMMYSSTGDTVSLQLAFADGSIGTVHYFANGNRSFPKETLQVFVSGRILQLENFRKLKGYGWPRFRSMNLWRMDKGQRQCVQAFVDAIASGSSAPISFPELLETAKISCELSSW